MIKKINGSKIWGVKFNLERVFDITHFEEILESLMHGEFLGFSLKFV
jgi:hypothetical protein